jgi:hypothetical protein
VLGRSRDYIELGADLFLNPNIHLLQGFPQKKSSIKEWEVLQLDGEVLKLVEKLNLQILIVCLVLFVFVLLLG